MGRLKKRDERIGREDLSNLRRKTKKKEKNRKETSLTKPNLTKPNTF